MASLKSKISEWKKTSEQIEQSMDISNWMPGYWDPRFFKVGFLIIMILLIVIISLDGFVNRAYFYSCPSDFSEPCFNPFYVCKHGEDSLYNCDVPRREEVCAEGICDKEFIEPGEFVGRKPHFLTANFYELMFSILLVCAGLNHLNYRLRTGNWKYVYPEFIEVCAHDWKKYGIFKKRKICSKCLKKEKVKQ